MVLSLFFLLEMLYCILTVFFKHPLKHCYVLYNIISCSPWAVFLRFYVSELVYFPLICLLFVGLSKFPMKKKMAYFPSVTWNWLNILSSILIRSSHFASEIINLQNRKKVGSSKVQNKRKAGDFSLHISNEWSQTHQKAATCKSSFPVIIRLTSLIP